MNTYISLIRGINVSGQKKLPMAELRELLSIKGLQDVKTYIQSGNVVFQHSAKAPELSVIISNAIREKFGYEVPVITLQKSDIDRAIALSPYSKEAFDEPNKVMITFFDQKPNPEGVDELNKLKLEGEFFQIENDHMHFYFSMGAGQAKMNNNLIERKLKVQATTRNWRTLHKLLEMLD